jgi:hypothetical protein
VEALPIRGVVGDSVVTVAFFVWFDVDYRDDGRCEAVMEAMLDLMSDVVALLDTQVRIDTYRGSDLELVAVPADLETGDADDTRNLFDGRPSIVDEFGVNSVEETTNHLPSSLHQQPEDGDGDD